jgi:hypothetical protein
MDQQATRTKARSYTEDYKRQVVDLVVSSGAHAHVGGKRGRAAPDVAVPLGAPAWCWRWQGRGATACSRPLPQARAGSNGRPGG